VLAKALKKRKVEEEDESDEEEEEEEEEADGVEDTPSRPRQRVVAKGTNVPAHADTFNALAERYHLSSLLLSNLALQGFTQPTGIQSYGIPILLEVFAVFPPGCFFSHSAS
jgi:ATP-dependent RNA helicase DDX52/ROK1